MKVFTQGNRGSAHEFTRSVVHMDGVTPFTLDKPFVACRPCFPYLHRSLCTHPRSPRFLTTSSPEQQYISAFFVAKNAPQIHDSPPMNHHPSSLLNEHHRRVRAQPLKIPSFGETTTCIPEGHDILHCDGVVAIVWPQPLSHYCLDNS